MCWLCRAKPAKTSFPAASKHTGTEQPQGSRNQPLLQTSNAPRNRAVFKENRRQLCCCYYFLLIIRHTMHRTSQESAEQWRGGKYPLPASEAARFLSINTTASVCAAQLHLHCPRACRNQTLPRDPQAHALLQVTPLLSDILQDPKKY